MLEALARRCSSCARPKAVVSTILHQYIFSSDGRFLSLGYGDKTFKLDIVIWSFVPNLHREVGPARGHIRQLLRK